MGLRVRSKKMAPIGPVRQPSAAGQIAPKMVRIGFMATRFSSVDRRGVLAGLGTVAATALLTPFSLAQGRKSLLLRAKPGTIALRPGRSETPVWSLDGPAPRFKRGDPLEVTFQNDLPVPATLDWLGLEGAPAAEPWLAQLPVAPGAQVSFSIPLRHAGTLLCDLRTPGGAMPARPISVIVGESAPITADHDAAILIEDFRLRPDGTAIPAGNDPKDAAALYTVNGRITPEIPMRSQNRLRLRLINACQRQAIAVKIDGVEVRVMAMDSQPAEPFPARNGALVLAPRGRIDALIDATRPPGTSADILLHDGKEARAIAKLVISAEPPARPAPMPLAAALPSNGLPAQLDLRSALRVELALQGNEWTPLANVAQAAPLFRTKPGRVVVLALTNRAAIATVFHLHGHHFRLLDRLDDGWKPFWLDTLAIEPGQTQRIAFAAQYAGRWLLECTATDWAAPRLMRWYAVD
jgi:FtsP/CotA-like multicopper oxidase with cupredoxin domain